MAKGPRDWDFGRLRRPPLPGKMGIKKVDVRVFGVLGFDETPNERGAFGMKATKTFMHATWRYTQNPKKDGTFYSEPFMDTSIAADPSVKPAFYFATRSAHSVVLYEDVFMAVLGARSRYNVRDRHINPTQAFRFKHYWLIKPGTSYNHEKKGQSGVWEGLSEKSIEFLRQRLEAARG